MFQTGDFHPGNTCKVSKALDEVSGDIYTEDHLRALHVVPIYPANVFPLEYLPSDGDHQFEKIAADFSNASPGSFDTISPSCFAHVATALAQMPLRQRGVFDNDNSNDAIGEVRDRMWCYDEEGDVYDEEPREQWMLLRVLVGMCFVPLMGRQLRCLYSKERTKWVAGGRNGKRWSAKRCGYIFHDSYPYPIISLNATRRGSKTQQQHVAQEVGVLLAQVVDTLIYHGRQNNPNHQTAFAITLHGQFLHISSTSVPADYIRHVRQSRELSSQSSLEVRFSKEFNLMHSDDRREVARLLIGLFRFVFSKLGNTCVSLENMTGK